MKMQNNVVARKLVNVYGISYHIELRKEKDFEGRTIYRLYNVYDLDYPVCEEPRGCGTYYTIDDAIEHFEKVIGAELTDEYKEYVKYRDSRI